MSYDKGKTIREYMGGGYMKPMQYQTGGYIPGISRQLFGMNLARDIAKAQQEQASQARKIAKQEKRRGLFSKLGSIGGTIAGGALAAALAPVTGGASLAAGAALAKGLGSAGGSFLGEKVAEGTVDTRGVGRRSSTGLLGSGFDRLKDINEEASEGALGRSLATGVQTGLMAGGADFLKNLANPVVSADSLRPSLDVPSSDIGAYETTFTDLDVPDISDLLAEQDVIGVSETSNALLGMQNPISNFASLYNMGGMVKKKKYGYEEGGEMKMYAGGGLINMLPFNRRIM